jgi:AhpD family alkylhydroperoxidase
MDSMTQELIAIGASVTGHCVPCLEYHLEKARAAGAGEDDIREAVRIGRMVRRGSDSEWDDAAAGLLDEAKKTAKAVCDLGPPA